VLDTVKQRGVLNCGTDNTALGFGYLNTTTDQMEGLDVDFCKAVAAGVLGDASKVKFITVTDKSRFDSVLRCPEADRDALSWESDETRLNVPAFGRIQ